MCTFVLYEFLRVKSEKLARTLSNIHTRYMEARSLGAVPQESKLKFFYTIELSVKSLKEGQNHGYDPSLRKFSIQDFLREKRI